MKYKINDIVHIRDKENFIRECTIIHIKDNVYDIKQENIIYTNIKKEDLYADVGELIKDYMQKGLFRRK